MTNTNSSHFSITEILLDCNHLEKKDFLTKYNKAIRSDSLIQSFYMQLNPSNLDQMFDMIKARLVSLYDLNSKLSFAKNADEKPKKIAKAASKKYRDPMSRTGHKKNGEIYRLGYVVELFDKNGKVTETFGAEGSSAAVSLAVRKLAQDTTFVSAQYYSTNVLTEDGMPIKTEISKQDAVAEFYKTKAGSVTKRNAPANSKLEWGGKAKQKHFHFSRG